jgi:nicotinamide riboside kinase
MRRPLPREIVTTVTIPSTAMPVAPLRIALVGAESTGKSTLAASLAGRLGDEFGLRAAVVPELLRAWCDARGRTPTAAEQWEIAREQQRLIDAAAAFDADRAIDVVVCDTTPLMTAVYSRMVFDDGSLDAYARECHAGVDLTLLTALDLPWIADGLQRDGPHVRVPVDRLVRERLVAWGARWTVVSGADEARVECAVEAVRPALARWIEGAEAGAGLFTGLLASRTGPARPMPRCERCDSGVCEHLARAVRR